MALFNNGADATIGADPSTEWFDDGIILSSGLPANLSRAKQSGRYNPFLMVNPEMRIWILSFPSLQTMRVLSSSTSRAHLRQLRLPPKSTLTMFLHQKNMMSL